MNQVWFQWPSGLIEPGEPGESVNRAQIQSQGRVSQTFRAIVRGGGDFLSLPIIFAKVLPFFHDFEFVDFQERLEAIEERSEASLDRVEKALTSLQVHPITDFLVKIFSPWNII